MPWACVHTYGGMERRATENLERQEYRVAMPLIRCRNPRSLGELVERPLFPCYVFVMLAPDQRWSSVNGTRGVIRLLTTGGADDPRPMFLPDGVVEAWRDPAEEPGLTAKRLVLPRGTVVRVRSPGHSFLGMEGVVEEITSAQRVHVLFSLFNRQTRVTFETPDGLERLDYATAV